MCEKYFTQEEFQKPIRFMIIMNLEIQFSKED